MGAYYCGVLISTTIMLWSHAIILYGQPIIAAYAVCCVIVPYDIGIAHKIKMNYFATGSDAFAC